MGWFGGPNKIIAYIGTQAYTRKLVEQNGYFLVHIPTVQQMETMLYAGEHSKYTMPNKLDNLDLFYQPECAIPLVVGSAGYLLCQVIPNQHQEQNFDSFMGEIVSAWADDRVFDGRHWLFDTAPDELRTVHYVAGGQFYAIGKGTKLDHGPGQDQTDKMEKSGGILERFCKFFLNDRNLNIKKIKKTSKKGCLFNTT